MATRVLGLCLFASIVAIISISAACTGDLIDLDEQAAAGAVRYAPVIQRDLDSLGCAGSGTCHGGSAPMRLIPSATDDVTLMLNYAQVKPRSSSGEMSLLLLKTLRTSGTGHAGSQPFPSKNDEIYKRWLEWINNGAPYGGAAPGDGGTATPDMAGGENSDMASGGDA